MKKQEIRNFQSEVKQLLNLMIHSLYSKKEIFLRELISNSSDAADKLRFYALSNPDLYEGEGNLHVRISLNKDNSSVTISDNCIGMNYDEVISNLGTIAKSGTKDFIRSIKNNTENDKQLIGQFGVGFYSAFIVADKVIVHTRAAGSNPEEGVIWESRGKGEYIISNSTKENRGTEITLFLRKGEESFLDDSYIRSIINKYSDYITLPIEIEKRSEKNGKYIISWERINKTQALWTRSKSEIKTDEYHEFYKYITNDQSNPLTWSHNRVEGKQEYTCLLYIPSQAPWNIWNRDFKRGLKLYVRRVFIMDTAEQFLPNYLRFVRGIIDSNDLPLNISREILQDNTIINNLRNAITKRILNMLEKLNEDSTEKYQIFWKQFGNVLKEGISEDISNQKTISKMLRFSSTYTNSPVQTVSLENYVSRMKNNQEKIYYITADNFFAAKNSPHLELICKRNIEVLLLYDRIDEWMINYLVDFNGTKFQSISKKDFSIEELSNKSINDIKKIEKDSELFLERVKNVLGNRVKDVKSTYRLIDTPAIVTTDSEEMTTQMAKLFTAAGQETPEIKYIFELNLDHPLVKYIKNIKEVELFKEWVEFLLDQSLLSECGTLQDLNSFIKKMNKFLVKHTILY